MITLKLTEAERKQLRFALSVAIADRYAIAAEIEEGSSDIGADGSQIAPLRPKDRHRLARINREAEELELLRKKVG